MSENIRVGLIGYGYASKTFHAPLVAGTPGMELAAITSSDETKVRADWPAVPVVTEPKHLFNDPNIDLIIIQLLTTLISPWRKRRWRQGNMLLSISPSP